MTSHYSDQLGMLNPNQFDKTENMDVAILSKSALKDKLKDLNQHLVELENDKQCTTNEIALIVDELSKRS